ncbi:IclR family transcriptional regulator [Yoonia sp. GPGPB17]|uniref:IclR family transcriptional regulator n=1 Tax=Yoonia sp. GPGPB17 TaxID=3026147 RepID=UPI0030BB0E11
MSESDRHVESVLSALAVLDCFESDEPLRLKDFHARTGLTRSRIIRLAGTLMHKGYLTQDKETSQYRLGPTLFRLSTLLSDRFGSLSARVRPTLVELVASTGLTAMFSVVGGRDRLILTKEEPDQAVRYTVKEGQQRAIHLGASGRVLLAFSRPSLASDILDSLSLSEGAKAALYRDLEPIREKGFDLSESELTRHAFAVAVPVLANTGELQGALTLAGPTLDYSRDKLEHLVALLNEKSKILERGGTKKPVQSAQT